MSELHWSTISWATINLVLSESGVFTIDHVRSWVRDDLEDLLKCPQVLSMLQSEADEEVIEGLKLISDATLDWETLGLILAVLLEEMVDEELSVEQVVETLRLLNRKVQEGELNIDKKVAQDFARDEFSLGMFSARLDAIEHGQSSESLIGLQEDVDRWLSCYASL